MGTLQEALEPIAQYFREQGKRNSSSDQQIIQTIHDHAMSLGAACKEPDADDMTEREIPQSERDEMADSDFAGKGTSFPIKTQEDVDAAMHSIGRAGSDNYSHDKIKANIIRIAKRKGLKVPGQDSKESASTSGDDARLVESVAVAPEILFSESAGANPMLKIISPGRGSTGYYTKELLQRDGPQIFKRGTLGYINHATDAEEAARPEGDWEKLAYVTTADAKWVENHREGAALYAPVKLFENRAAEVKDKAPYTGASIRARGQYAEASTGKPNPKVKYHESKLAPDGKPGLIARLTAADSIDLVTRAGRDGKLLLESASAESQHKENEMDESQVKALLKESLAPLETKLTEAQAENKRLRERLAMSEAPKRIREALADIRLPDASKNKICRRLAETALPDDIKELNKLVESEALAEAEFLRELGYGQNVAAFGARIDEKDLRENSKEAVKAHEAAYDEALKSMSDIFVGPKLVTGGEDVREARKAARKAFREGRVA